MKTIAENQMNQNGINTFDFIYFVIYKNYQARTMSREGSFTWTAKGKLQS